VGRIGAWVSGELLGNVFRSRRMLGWGGIRKGEGVLKKQRVSLFLAKGSRRRI